MREGEIEKQFKMLQKQIALIGEEVEILKRQQRAEIDNLNLKIETLRRCLGRLDIELDECFGAVWAEVMHETDPETL